VTTPFSTGAGASPPSAGTGGGDGAGRPVAVAVIDRDQATRARIGLQLGQGANPLESVAELLPRLSGQPVVVVLGPSFAEGGELAAVGGMLAAHREVGAIMVTAELTTDVLQRALRAGVKDVLPSPVDGTQLAEAVQRVASTLVAAPVAPAVLPVGEGEQELGRVITVFSTKGGAGKSVVATNLAVLLAQRSDRPVVLIDADLQFGDIAVMLKLAPHHTIADAVGIIADPDRQLDQPMLESLLSRHAPSGLLVMPAPLEPAYADQIGADEMGAIVEMFRQLCGFVIIDTPAYFNDVVLGLIDVSDDVLLVAGMDIPNIKNVKIGLQTFRLLNMPMQKVKLVLNRANSKVKLDVAEVERTLGIEAEALIPSDVVVPQAVNKGEPVVASAPRSGVAKSFEQLADLFLPQAARKKR
jgi:pilus assembly protein CpaE